ncbi:hypothetical protein [Nocardiopsis sp. FIRDI 009]|uniref:hypothetical protein n=1 Tax=Nocardiopsis sp. FIRDI 009 TaxID=714197 RepID=UPI000E23F291|nr:hypothetical protein [Nocardiopsis sp. FIRDI 009]
MGWKDRLASASDTARRTAGTARDSASRHASPIAGRGADVVRAAGGRGAEATRRANERAGEAARRARDRSAEMAEAAQEIRESLHEMAWVTDVLDRLEVPSEPGEEPFRLSVGSVIEAAWEPPRPVRRLLGLLDRLGAVEVGVEAVGFDGSAVPWKRVRQIQARRTSDILLTSGLDMVSDSVTGLLPPVPGRAWIAAKAVDVVSVLTLTAVTRAEREEGRKDMEEFDRAADEAGFGLLPCHIEYGRLLWRTGRLDGGPAAALFMAVKPEIRSLVRTGARLRGVPLTVAPFDDRLTSIAERSRGLAEVRERVLSRPTGPEPELVVSEEPGGDPGEAPGGGRPPSRT